MPSTSHHCNQCYFSKETSNGTQTVTQHSVGEGGSLSFKNCAHYASLFERTEEG
jgi:hypothetical protein